MHSDLEPLDEFDQIQRVTQRVVRGALVGFPTWILLLLLFPLTGLGVMPCFFGATIVTIAVVILAERRHRRRHADPASGPVGRTHRPMSALTAVALTLGGVAVLAYVLFVIRAA
jgi:ABC-type Fe3+-siderophore transport system permease subunit